MTAKISVSLNTPRFISHRNVKVQPDNPQLIVSNEYKFMKILKAKSTVIYIRTDEQTKQDFLEAVKQSCIKYNTLGEIFIKAGIRNIKRNKKKGGDNL